MAIIEKYTDHGFKFRATEYDTYEDIQAFLNENDLFHDGVIEHISHDAKCTVVSFRHYDDDENTIRWLKFTGGVELTMDLDLLVRYLYEINLTCDGKFDVSFVGTGIVVRSDRIKAFMRQRLV